MNYPILSLPLTGGTCLTEDPHVSETRTVQAALCYWRGQISPMANSPVMTSSLGDPRDLTRRLDYLVGPLIGASDDGGGHGSSAGRNDGVMPVEATVAQPRARTSITELR